MTDYTLEYEKKFIDGLGTGRFYDWSERRKHPSRMDLLKSYRKALAKRVKWNGVDKDVVNSYLSSAIFKERGNVQINGI